MRVNCREQIANPAEPVNGQDERRKCAAVDSPSPCPLGFLPNQLFLLSNVRSGSIAKAMLSVESLFPYPYPHPVGVLVELE